MSNVRHMQDTCNPNEQGLVEWAYSSLQFEPVQDFDLMVTSNIEPSLIMQLAADPTCPKQVWFLHCLYLLIGDAVRTQYQTSDKKQIRVLLKSPLAESTESLQKWVFRSHELIKNPSQFSYDQWCAGGFAYER